MTKSFANQIDAIFDKYDRQLERIAKTATREVFEEAQKPRSRGGRMPVESGKLRESLTVKGRAGRFTGATSYRAVAAMMQPGDVVVGGWSTGYERLAEYRAGFREAAATSWPQIVARSIARAKATVR